MRLHASILLSFSLQRSIPGVGMPGIACCIHLLMNIWLFPVRVCMWVCGVSLTHTITNNAAVNICGQVISVDMCFHFLGQISRSGITGFTTNLTRLC